MTARTITCTQPGMSRPVVITVTVNINIDRLFWLAFAVLWLASVILARLGRFLNRLYEIGRAVIVVAWRRVRRALHRTERRFSWYFEGLAYSLAYALLGRGPVMGVG